MATKLISIVVPVFNEAAIIVDFLRALNEIVRLLPLNFEIIVIDDGSKDGTWDKLTRIATEITGLKSLRFSRNFGKESAIYAGLKFSSGDAVVVIDSDFQHPPELIPQFIKHWQTGVRLVRGVKRRRPKQKFGVALGTKFFDTLFRFLSGIDLSGICDFQLIDRSGVNMLIKADEGSVLFRGATARLGFETVNISFDVPDRLAGSSKWSYPKLFRLAFAALLYFSLCASKNPVIGFINRSFYDFSNRYRRKPVYKIVDALNARITCSEPNQILPRSA